MKSALMRGTAAAIIALSASFTASAQTEDGQAGAAAPAFGDIIVTATRRSESLQNVAIAVSAVGSEQLKASGITDLRELQVLTPTLFLSSSASEVAGTVARIRGVGTTGDNPGLESSVAIFIDGVYRSRNNVGLTELGEVERIEVLRGPQGTLFGRNASAGLINVITKGPQYDLGGYAEASYGNYDYLRMAGGVTGGISDRAALRLDAVYQQRDGFFDDLNGEDYNNRDRWLLRGQALFDATDDLSIRLIADYSKRREDCCAASTIVAGPTAGIIRALGGELGSGAGGTASTDPYDRESATSEGRGFQGDVNEWGLSGEINWETGIGTLTSITAYRDWKANRGQDVDYTSLDILYRDDGQLQQFRTFSQELRLQGEAFDDRLDWLVGGYFASEKLTYQDAIRVGGDYQAFANALVRAASPTFPGYENFPLAVAGTLIGNGVPSSIASAAAALAPSIRLNEGDGGAIDDFRQKSTNFAIFTHNTYDVTDRLSVTLGARYTDEKKKLNADLSAQNTACSALIGYGANPGIPAAAAGNPVLEGAIRAVASGLVSATGTLPCLPFFNPFLDGAYDSEINESELTGTGVISFKATDDLLTYASYSRGYKAGGFNLDRAGLPNPILGGTPTGDDLQFDAETVDSFELGFKYSNRVQGFGLNGSLFYAKFSDFQLNTFDGIAFIVENLPKVTSKGIELEGFASPVDGLNLTAGFNYTQAEYGTEGFDGPLFAPPSATNLTGGALFLLPGEQITNAPKVSVSGAATYQPELVNGTLKGLFHIDARYTSEINTGSDLRPEKVQEGIVLVNARIGVSDPDDKWAVELWARNLFDKDYTQVAFNAPLQGSGTSAALINTQTYNAFLAEPRTYGVTLKARF